MELKSFVMRLRAFRVALVATCLITSSAFAADTLSDAKALLSQGKAAQAYDLLSSQEQISDNPEFDYVYGIAALDAGHPGIALFAFERVLALQPDHLFARAELCRALFKLGEFRQAFQEAATLRAMNPPPEVAARIAEYQAAAKQKPARPRKFGGFAEAILGYDTNFNSATSDGQVALPAFGNVIFTLDDLFTKDGSMAAGARTGGYYVTPISRRFTFIANIDVEAVDFPEAEDEFFYVSLRGGFGIRHQHDARNAYTLAFNAFQTWVGDLDYLRSFALSGSWQHTLNEHDMIESYVRVGDLSYDDVIDYRDAGQYLGGVNFSRSIGKLWTLEFGVFGGAEIERDDERADIGRELYGARIAGNLLVTDRARLFVEVSGQFSDYRGRDELFRTTRDDEQVRLTVGLKYAVNRSWSVRPELRYTHNNSNIATNEFERFEGLLFIRRDFN